MLQAKVLNFAAADLNLPHRRPAVAPLTIYDLPAALEPASLPVFEARELLVAACQARVREFSASALQPLTASDLEVLSLFQDPGSNDITDSRTGRVWQGRVNQVSPPSTMPESSPLLNATVTPSGVGARQPSDLPPSLELPQSAVGATPNSNGHSPNGNAAKGMAGFAPHPRTRSFRLPYDVLPTRQLPTTADSNAVPHLTDIEDSEPMYAAVDRAYLGAVSGGYDCYLDPVTRELHFTEEFLRQGGRCCGYACRHCPFRTTSLSLHASHTPPRRGTGKRTSAGNGTLVLARSPVSEADKSTDSDYRSSSASEERGNTTSDSSDDSEGGGRGRRGVVMASTCWLP